MNVTERKELVISHMSLADKIAYHKKKSLPSFINCDELKSAAYLGLCDAASRYNPEYKFAPYASVRIFGAITDFLRELGWGSRAQYSVACYGDDFPLELWVSDEGYSDNFNELVECLQPNQRQIMAWYYVDNFTMKQIGHKLDVTESRVSQIIAECKQVLKKEELECAA